MLLVFGGGGYYVLHVRKINPAVKPAATVPEKKALPVPVKSEAIATPVPQVTSGYVIGVLSVSKSVNGESIQLEVTNDGDTVLRLLPDQQFKLAGLTSHEERVPLKGKTTAGFKGEIASNAKLSGTMIFDTFVSEQSELRFYPDILSKEYIVVPLITLPSDQQ